MARADYWDFIDEARDVFGLTLGEAREFWRDLQDELDERPTVADLDSDEALALFDQYIEEEEPEEGSEEGDDGYDDYDDLYPRDERYELEYGDDDIIFEGDEVEVTAELEYEERGR